MKEYAHILHALADGKTIQERNDDGTWQDRGATHALGAVSAETVHRNDPTRFRIKPETININGHEVPAPLREAPAVGVEYWLGDPTMTNHTERPQTWLDDTQDIIWLARGLCHSTKEAAQAHARALLSFTEKAQ